MTLQDIIDQCADDSRFWFPEQAEDLPFMALALGGEVGELSNYVKKVARGTHSFSQLHDEIEGEAIDAFIYLMNIFALLGTDVEVEYNVKRQFNVNRFGRTANPG